LKQRDLVLLIIDRCSDHPEFGRTSLQKIAYFSALRLGIDIGHTAHFYGPFSHNVERELDALTLSDLAEERAMGLGFANSAGYEARKYEYRITDTGRRRIAEIETSHSDAVHALDELVGLIADRVGGFDQRFLSTAAKTLYIAIEQGRPLSVQEASELAREHGWEVTPRDIGRVFELLQDLGFVETT
jgi:uncharacterized protein YwgA